MNKTQLPFLNNMLMILSLLLFSCDSGQEEISKETQYTQTLTELHRGKPEQIFPIEYYKTEIAQFRKMFDERQHISNIVEVPGIIPGSLSFLVCWDDNLKGYIYELYTFDENQRITNKYLCGYGPFLHTYQEILMEKIPGNRVGNELITIGDFNSDGVNEIASYSFYVNIGYVFTIFGFNELKNDFSDLCIIPVLINFETPFSPIEFNENEFKILEVVDNEYLELAWNTYVWDKNTVSYIRSTN
ncbi:hypothetical protein [Breznakiella homolactica]|uniref:VCBS repeat-containing protein n=1 Tax=Breznakiella homolactica TaxID=2798577 RepID=A0A7T7XPD7_9SPIR|nr:hypothetical protein [Breznakiella homolactica]QQO09928.1 hypothetical protein JFL75_03175 [Breznakiella homolactica]